MSSCSISYLGGVFDRAATILCGSDTVTDPVMGRIITPLPHDIVQLFTSLPPFELQSLEVAYGIGAVELRALSCILCRLAQMSGWNSYSTEGVDRAVSPVSSA